MEFLSILARWAGYGIAGLTVAFIVLVLVIVALMTLPDLLPQDAGGVALYVGLGALLFSPAFPVAVLALLGVLIWRHLRRCRKRPPENRHERHVRSQSLEK